MNSSGEYLKTVHAALWAWADQHHEGQLDGGSRIGRSPVLKRDSAAMNVLVGQEGAAANKVRGFIAAKQRHRHFASLRSSQALAQSVFGAISVLNRLDILETIITECGRPAFFKDHRGWSLSFEHEVSTLGEPRPTSIDVLLSGPGRRVAIECKFTESEFGVCSRPQLRPDNGAYATQRCDGDYRAQAGRIDRCALTTIGVRYWEYLPELFNWPADRDQAPCRFGAVYQLARNALAAVITPDGGINLSQGHALIVYDANNPTFQAGGEADRQWEATVADCLVPGLVRRISWQNLLNTMASSPELAPLVDALQQKYALARSMRQMLSA
jgi:hypothetical protein